MILAEFNSLPVDDVYEALLPCVGVPRWVTDVVNGRPYHNIAELMVYAEHAAPTWTDEEIDRALSRHPRIGEQPVQPTVEAAFSRREQGGLSLSEEMTHLIRAGNISYEERFGHVFLIRAAGRTPTEILQSLTERIANSPDEERPIVARELRDIALIRLRGIVEP